MNEWWNKIERGMGNGGEKGRNGKKNKKQNKKKQLNTEIKLATNNFMNSFRY